MSLTQVTPSAMTAAKPPLLPASANFAPSDLPGVRKAALLILALGEEVATPLLRGLEEHDVQTLTDELLRVRDVPADLLTQVVTEFYGLLETRQYLVQGGRDYALRVLTEAFGEKRARELLNHVHRLQERTHGDLAMLQAMEPLQLSKFLENEHPQTIALVLAHLDAEKGSTLLTALKPEMRASTVRRLAEMRQFSPEMAQKVALVLARRMDSLGSTGRRSHAGFQSVAELLNRLGSTESREILEQIESTDPKLAIGIRDLMFTFEDLLTVPATSVREIVAAADKRTLALALKGAKEQLRAHLFQAMSSRAMEMLREDMEALGPVRQKDVLAAQQELLAVARRLEAEGKVVLGMEGEGEYAV